MGQTEQTAGKRAQPHLTTTGQFQVVMKRLVSGALFKVSCRSLGLLEAKVRDALVKN